MDLKYTQTGLGLLYHAWQAQHECLCEFVGVRADLWVLETFVSSQGAC